jgi:glycosyltransferase involved in cell wall biosynthesis
MVANARTAHALPKVRGRVETVVENGVDLAVYQQRPAPDSANNRTPRDGSPHAPPVRFAFAGRLVHWKGVDLLLQAVKIARQTVHLHLDIIGDGRRRPALIDLAKSLGVDDAVTFHGWMSHANCAALLAQADVFVLPSLRECGGAAVLEAMAMRLPVIATRWGGPVDYLDSPAPGSPPCGLLVDPAGPDPFPTALAAAMTTLAQDPTLRRTLGDAAYARVLAEYDWTRKIDRVLTIYQDALTRHAPAKTT